MDIYLVSPTNEKYLIELKLPKENCGTPKEMYHAIQDVKFAEELKLSGFKSCYCLLITERTSFWQALRQMRKFIIYSMGMLWNLNLLIHLICQNFYTKWSNSFKNELFGKLGGI